LKKLTGNADLIPQLKHAASFLLRALSVTLYLPIYIL
jgi:hypothetical protein